jgi:hypothetical protein
VSISLWFPQKLKGNQASATLPQAAYEGLVAHMRATLPPEDLECMYLYPAEYLHLTVTSPAPFAHKFQRVPGIAVEDEAQRKLVGTLGRNFGSLPC